MNEIISLFLGATTLAGLKTLLLWLAVTGLVNLAAKRAQVEAFAGRHPKLQALLALSRHAGLDWVEATKSLAEFLRAFLPEKLRDKTPTLLVMLCAALLPGCAGSFEVAKTTRMPRELGATADAQRCESLDSQRVTWGAVAKGAGVLAAGSGIAALPVEGDDAKLGLAVGALAAGAVSVVSVYVAEQRGDAWVRECSE